MLNPVLDSFGRQVMRSVRDRALATVVSALEGTARAPDLRQLHAQLATLTSDQKNIALKLAFEAVDQAIHNVMSMTDSGDISIHISDQNKNLHSLVDLSDGLAGELYGKNGWIANYSKYPSQPDDSVGAPKSPAN